ncbi:hypothetical protein BX616_007898 [Lobosporangium transversale]|uniref:Uncharacterized protein n=1 Tax=Lobosporangium transversale TaxID=64571 RepID=A0A1Y2GX03_9FUNG|nr:hypothetical protein BCR41DRAFT_393496 [Lobosporangium transversale]KAF9914639.1 hypothetical protein BX616_007898 [Lobosporangium transversale]ORZ26301.1 hypothetical protein BCR41DRAFT_393496 [Lobosporangium transversale]|eukprot:XP_021884066.1 hypothetical protein BCR41DRAFT_393496 [Lobosporangium transversale]
MSSSVPLPSLMDIVQDLSILHTASISLTQQSLNTKMLDEDITKPAKTSVQKLEQFKASTERSQREEGVVESGFEVAADFLKMQQQLSVSKQEMNTLQERIAGLEKELTEVRELIAFNPVK